MPATPDSPVPPVSRTRRAPDMAEIEFKRRGTPLWLVLLILLVVGGGAYAWFAGRGGDPATQTAATPAAGSPAPATPAPGASSPSAAPAPAAGPAAELVRFVGTREYPGTDAAAQRAYLVEGVRHLATAATQLAPTSGVQINLLRAVADTLALPETTPRRMTDLTQLAFFAFGHAMGSGSAVGVRLQEEAGQLQPGVAIGQQSKAVRNFFRTAADLVQNPQRANAPAPGTPGAAPPTQPAAPGGPPAGGTKQP